MVSLVHIVLDLAPEPTTSDPKLLIFFAGTVVVKWVIMLLFRYRKIWESLGLAFLMSGAASLAHWGLSLLGLPVNFQYGPMAVGLTFLITFLIDSVVLIGFRKEISIKKCALIALVINGAVYGLMILIFIMLALVFK